MSFFSFSGDFHLEISLFFYISEIYCCYNLGYLDEWQNWKILCSFLLIFMVFYFSSSSSSSSGRDDSTGSIDFL